MLHNLAVRRKILLVVAVPIIAMSAIGVLAAIEQQTNSLVRQRSVLTIVALLLGLLGSLAASMAVARVIRRATPADAVAAPATPPARAARAAPAAPAAMQEADQPRLPAPPVTLVSKDATTAEVTAAGYRKRTPKAPLSGAGFDRFATPTQEARPRSAEESRNRLDNFKAGKTLASRDANAPAQMPSDETESKGV